MYNKTEHVMHAVQILELCFLALLTVVPAVSRHAGEDFRCVTRCDRTSGGDDQAVSM